MPDTKRITLIIDGNNLAHYLQHLPSGQGLSANEIFRLAIHLSNYAHQIQPAVTIELCIDPLPAETEEPSPPWVRCLVAPANSSADDLLRERFRFHQHRGTACVVITNDGEIRESVEEEGGECLLVYDFVRRVGKSPVFRQPREFNAVRARRTAPTAKKPPELNWDRLLMPLTVAAEKGTSQNQEVQPEPLPPPRIAEAAPLEVQQSAELTPVTLPACAAPTYRLAFETWPPESGLHFLLDSFCDAHRQDEDWQLYQMLAVDEIRPADLRDLAILLRQRCGAEPGFAQHGSLMKQVRLALVQSEDFRLSLQELVDQTGLNARGLQGRIREKAAPWLEIIQPPEKHYLVLAEKD